MPAKYPLEFKNRALRLLADRMENHPEENTFQACTQIASKIGMGAETLRRWRKQQQIDTGSAPGITIDMATCKPQALLSER